MSSSCKLRSGLDCLLLIRASGLSSNSAEGADEWHEQQHPALQPLPPSTFSNWSMKVRLQVLGPGLVSLQRFGVCWLQDPDCQWETWITQLQSNKNRNYWTYSKILSLFLMLSWQDQTLINMPPALLQMPETQGSSLVWRASEPYIQKKLPHGGSVSNCLLQAPRLALDEILGLLNCQTISQPRWSTQNVPF